MARHAYMIIAHSNWEQLSILLTLLDSKNNDIYVHIDKKARQVPVSDLKTKIKLSNIQFYQEYTVYWGSFELVQTELFLMAKAHEKHYDYYHLLSGADLPIKSQREIDRFFEEHKGYEFVHFDTDERLHTDKEIERRTQLYHFLQNYRRRYKMKIFNFFFTTLERSLLLLQLICRINRMKKYPDFNIRYGSQWVSITDDLVDYLINQKNFIEKIFRYTNCADELFIQSLVYNSQFKERLYHQQYDDDIHGNMRLIDMKKRGKNGNPYTWEIGDWEEIKDSDCLFARKFDIRKDEAVVRKICDYVKD